MEVVEILFHCENWKDQLIFCQPFKLFQSLRLLSFVFVAFNNQLEFIQFSIIIFDNMKLKSFYQAFQIYLFKKKLLESCIKNQCKQPLINLKIFNLQWIKIKIKNRLLLSTEVIIINKFLVKFIFNQGRMLSRQIKRGFSLLRRYQDIHERERRNLQFGVPTLQINYRYNQQPIDTKPINLQNLQIVNLADTQDFTNIAHLQHGLSKCLDGRIYQGDRGIGAIPSLSNQFLSSISDYKKPSEDKVLLDLAEKHKCKYSSSTSNISSLLLHMYYLFSSFRRPCMNNVFENILQPKIHMISYRKPHTFILKKCKGQYVIQSDPGLFHPSNEVLLKNGIVLQYLLTTPKAQIDREIETGKTFKKPQYYRYNKTNSELLLRSQIDCREKGPNGKQYVFQIKTRAICPIRYDVENYKKYLDYELKTINGQYQSYERQYYDLIRGGLLKYSFQLMIGNMEGAFVAYHNTVKIFGYEYIGMKQIINRFFGTQFNMNLTYVVGCKMVTSVLDIIAQQYKNENSDLKIGFYANSYRKSLVVFVEILDQQKGYEKMPLTSELYGVQNYFSKNQGIKNKIYKYQFEFFVFNKKILVRNPDIIFTPTDDITLEWKWKCEGRVTNSDYINFLHDAYKLDSHFGSFKYNGSWSRTEGDL